MDRLGEPRPPPWSDLPPELGGLILRLLCHIDRLRFRRVCRQWRLAERQQRHHLPLELPLIWLNNQTFQSLAGGEACRFCTDQVDVLRRRFPSYRGCFDGWLLYQRYSEDSQCFLINPLSRASIEIPLRLNDGAKFNRYPMRKIIVCSPDLIAAILWGSSVGFYRPGALSWSACPGGRGRGLYVDMALYRGKLYALNTEDGLFVHEVGDAAAGLPKASHVFEQAIMAQTTPEMANPEGLLLTRRYLVVSCTGKLLMVKWMVPSRGTLSSMSTDGVVLKVFEADLEMGRWMEVSNLDSGQALFVSGGCSKAVRLTAGNDQRFQENCVYVLGHDFFGYCYNVMPSYCSYDLRNGTISEVVLDRMRVVWPVWSMEWFFPQE